MQASFSCPICDEAVECPGYVGQATCKCGAVYEYDECTRITTDSLRAISKSWPRPIPVADRLPEKGQDVLAHIVDRRDGSSGWTNAELHNGEWIHGWDEGDGWHVITHWLPMPPAPTEST